MQALRGGRTIRAAGAVALVLAAVACSDDGDDSPGITESLADSGTDEGDDRGKEATGDDAETNGGSGQPTEPVVDDPPDEVLATVEGAAPFTELQIVDLRRVDDIVTLELVIVADGSGDSWDVFSAPSDQASGDEIRHTSVAGTTLVDTANNQRHLVLRDSEDLCLCTNFPFLPDEGSYPHSAQFPAPPDDVDSMSVQVPAFPVVDNVPLRSAG